MRHALSIFAAGVSTAALTVAGTAFAAGGSMQMAQAQQPPAQTGAAGSQESPQVGVVVPPSQNPNASVYENAGWTFENWDRDDDGVLSPQEIQLGLFGALDVDNDGRIEQGEYEQRVGLVTDAVPEYSHVFTDIDQDGDAEITDAEFLGATPTDGFETGWDVNDDGLVTRADWQRVLTDPTGAEDARQGVPGYGQEGAPVQQEAETPPEGGAAPQGEGAQ